MLLWIVLVFGGGHVYMTQINPTPTKFQMLESDVSELNATVKQREDLLAAKTQELKQTNDEFEAASEDFERRLEEFQNKESVLKDEIVALEEETEEYEENQERLKTELDEITVEVALKDELLDKQETDLIKMELDQNKSNEHWAASSNLDVTDEGDARFWINRIKNTDYDNAYNFKYHGTVDASATKIEVFVTNDKYGELGYYKLEQFEPGDTEWKYFTSPKFGTVMPGINTYRFVVTWEWGASSEYISLLEIQWTKMINDKNEEWIEKYSWTVKLNGTMKRSTVDVCSLGLRLGNDDCIAANGQIKETTKYELQIYAASDPRRWRFDGISNHDRVSLWCLQLRSESSKVRSDVALEVLKNKDDGAKVDVLINTKYAPTLVNTSACAVDASIESFDIVE